MTENDYKEMWKSLNNMVEAMNRQPNHVVERYLQNLQTPITSDNLTNNREGNQ